MARSRAVMNTSVTGGIVSVPGLLPSNAGTRLHRPQGPGAHARSRPRSSARIRSLRARNSQVTAMGQPRILHREPKPGRVLAALAGHRWNLAETIQSTAADAIAADHAEAPRDSDRRDDAVRQTRPVDVNHACYFKRR